ncbi:hypothetical protein [Nocardiopsis rhodophaea]|uniref:hypothetical protein n=1 Tax=Nocardiopsis rhodophaea TaxID=280238 RepID=UPI0031E1870E
MSISKRTAILALAGSLLTAHFSVPPAAAESVEETDKELASCYGGARFYSKAAGGYTYPASGYLRTTSRCNDINLKPRSSRTVSVCFKRTNRCNNAKWARGGQWNVIASNVRTGAGYYFLFSRYDLPSRGYFAH